MGQRWLLLSDERSLFDYLKLELSPAFRDGIGFWTLETPPYSRQPTRVIPNLVTYEVVAVAALSTASCQWSLRVLHSNLRRPLVGALLQEVRADLCQ